jgi:hypothetical protein
MGFYLGFYGLQKFKGNDFKPLAFKTAQNLSDDAALQDAGLQ